MKRLIVSKNRKKNMLLGECNGICRQCPVKFICWIETEGEIDYIHLDIKDIDKMRFVRYT